MARPSSRAFPTLVTVALIAALGISFFGLPAAAQDGTANETEGEGEGVGGNATGEEPGQPTGEAGGLEEIDYAFTVHEETCEGGCAFDIKTLSVPPGSTVYIVYDSTGASALHNAHPTEGAVDPVGVLQEGSPIAPDSGESSWLFTMPEEEGGEVTYVCDVHPEMTGVVVAGEFGGGAAGAESIVAQGVHFLAHWVGVIAFAVLFIMYGLTFFLFKYNETGFTTDHKDRAVPAGAGVDVYGEDVRVSKGTAVVLILLILTLAAGLVYAFVSGLIGPMG